MKHYNFKECHEGTIEVFKDPATGIPYCGGGKSRDLVIYPKHLIVSMANIDPDIVSVYNMDAPSLLEYNNQMISISWPDYSVPDLGHDFWLNLIDVINTEWAAGRIEGVTVCCVGGHGRTGTALSILAVLTGSCITDPVLFVRKRYCEKAVESKSQLAYVEKMTGMKTAAEASKTIGYQPYFDFKKDDHDYYGSSYYNSY